MIFLRPLDRGNNILNKEITSYIVYVYEVCTEKFIWPKSKVLLQTSNLGCFQ